MNFNLSFSTIFTLLIAFQVKHLIADFLLQKEYILRKSFVGIQFLLPLTLHCLIHAVLTLCIVLYVNPLMWKLAFFDFGAHFLMDRIKSSPKYLGRFKDMSQKGYWNSLGFDQMVHHLTHYFILWQLVRSLETI